MLKNTLFSHPNMELKLVVLSCITVTFVHGNHVSQPDIPANFPITHNYEIPGRDVKYSPDRIPGFMRYTPRKRDLNKKRLMRKMGSDFDARWMAIETPSLDDGHNDVVISDRAQQIDLKLTHFFQNLNFTFVDNRSKAVSVSQENVDLFRAWLLRHSSCPVTYVWQDQGVLFWPRWIRRGYCDASVSCSWPPGMSCVPAESKIINILRWNCRKRRKKGKKRRQKIRTNNVAVDKNDALGKQRTRRRKYRGMKCKWLKVPYPIIDECFCSC